MKIFAVATAACALALPGPASAATYAFRYITSSGAALSGRLWGSLQADNNLVLLTGVTSIAFDGVPQPLPAFQYRLRGLLTGDDSQPFATSLDGSVQNFCLADDGICSTNYVGFATDVFGSVGAYVYSSPFGPEAEGPEPYVAANWRLRAVSDVPEPAAWAMLIAGFGLVGVAARRRRPAPAA